MTCDVLNLEWASTGRDREAASLVCHALRGRGYSVIEDSVFNYRHLLLRHRPRLLYIADPTGARINHDAARFAERLGIPSISLDAEGDYVQGMAEQMFWGHVTDHRLTQRLKLLWSARARDLVLEVAPELADRCKVVGAVGFDRYRLETFATKAQWRERYRFEGDTIVGIAGWTFDNLFGSSAMRQPWLDSFGAQTVQRFQRDRDSLREVWRDVVRRQPDTQFVLKSHPGVVDPAESEFAGLEELPNVLQISSEETIADCISVSDVWMAFDSTTCLEAWLLGKPTLFVNPSGGDFPRTRVVEGTPVLRTTDDVVDALAEHAETGRIEAFDALATERGRVIEDTVQWTDGCNHQRAAYYFAQLLEGGRGPGRRRVSARTRLSAMLQNALFRGARYVPGLPGLRYHARARRHFDRVQLDQVTSRVARSSDSLSPGLSEDQIADLERRNR